jgi:1,4-dihydroxy-2-naphthoyl-CoA hydrolase
VTEPTPSGRDLVAMMPFAGAIGIEIERAAADEVVGSLGWDEARTTAGGLMHGGALMALADSVGAVCAFLNLPAGASTSTIESKTNFFRAVRSGVAHAVARPLHIGRTVIVVQTDITDDGGKRIAQVTQTQAILQST